MKTLHLIPAFLAVLLIVSCSAQKKIRTLQSGAVEPLMVPADIDTPQELVYDPLKRDTLLVHDDDGNEIVIMRAVKDENGEMVANDVIDAAKVTARFKNVAERHGKVDIRFQVIVPKEMQDPEWQLRFRPVMQIFDEEQQLDSIIISGELYRAAQLRGYRLYQNYLETIITDSTAFLRGRQLDIFLRRNASLANVSDSQAVEHYTKEWKVSLNDRRIERKDKMFAKYVKTPLITEGLKLDTVITSYDGEFLYEYTQTITTAPLLKSVSVYLDGAVYEGNTRLYTIPRCEPLKYYISSLSSFVDEREKYVTRIQDGAEVTAVDTTYMRGVQAIKDRDYKTAVTILRPYADFNAAVAYCALDYNASAMTILQSLDQTDKTEYMLAILFARAGNDKDAVQHYLKACQLNPGYVHRGNLDPEISTLIKLYGLNKD